MTLVEQSRVKPQQVSHSNTRFSAAPFPPTSGRGASAGVTDDSSLASTGDVEGDGGGDDSPRVNGYGFVVTPSPRPGADVDPTMTWGVIDGTPFRLDASDAADVSTGPIFKLPDHGPREAAAMRLQEDAARRKRKASRDAAAAAGSSSNKSGKRAASSTPASRLATMSPAAQRLGQQLLKGRSGVLSASYDGTPRATPTRSTPRVTPRVTPRATPSAWTPGSSALGSPRSSERPTGAHGDIATAPSPSSSSSTLLSEHAAVAGGSITDGLL
jgi:protein DGCR14